MAFTEKNLAALIKAAFENCASDIHIREGETPCFRIQGELIPIQTKEFSHEHIVSICEILSKNHGNNIDLLSFGEHDGSYSVKGFCRLRYNIFKYQRKIGITLRIINENIPTIEALGLPNILKKIALKERGLVLVTGATGSGKSTTLAAMIDYINNKQSCHIISIEDPIEYLHPQINSRITQREVNIDTENFSFGLKSALRQDPDVIFIGELRDTETITTALKAAETGHIVFSTVHTTDCIATIGRIIAMFPLDEQKEVRKRLAENLYSTISQRLLKRHDKKGMIAAFEIMITTPGIRECIEGKESVNNILKILREGKNKNDLQSQSFDQHIMELYQKGKISKTTAINSATSQSDFLLNLQIN